MGMRTSARPWSSVMSAGFQYMVSGKYCRTRGSRRPTGLAPRLVRADSGRAAVIGAAIVIELSVSKLTDRAVPRPRRAPRPPIATPPKPPPPMPGAASAKALVLRPSPPDLLEKYPICNRPRWTICRPDLRWPTKRLPDPGSMRPNISRRKTWPHGSFMSCSLQVTPVDQRAEPLGRSERRPCVGAELLRACITTGPRLHDLRRARSRTAAQRVMYVLAR